MNRAHTIKAGPKTLKGLRGDNGLRGEGYRDPCG